MSQTLQQYLPKASKGDLAQLSTNLNEGIFKSKTLVLTHSQMSVLIKRL